jgi:hypothetical protein
VHITNYHINPFSMPMSGERGGRARFYSGGLRVLTDSKKEVDLSDSGVAF